ncbi:MAG: N-acetyltransferase [Propionibacteriaceae bacterium]
MSPDLINITAARQEDLDAILTLERSGFAESEQWSRRSWQGELLGERRTILVARAHHLLGVICLQTVGPACDLQRLVVSPRARRQGVGSALVRAGIEAVRHLGADTIMLEVGWENDAAIALYQKLGFEQRAAREDYYGPGQHALILKMYDLQGPRPVPSPSETRPWDPRA